MATLFAYFGKSPKTKQSSKKVASNEGGKIKGQSQAKENLLQPSKNPGQEKKYDSKLNEWMLGDVVWSKMDEYPWWPAMVCNDPNSETHQEKKDQHLLFHVQFFGDPPTRDWIDAKNVCAFSERSFEGSKEVEVAYLQAKEAIPMTKVQRLDKYYACAVDVDGSDNAGKNKSIVESSDEDIGQIKSSKKRPNREARKERERKRVKMMIDSDDSSGDNSEESDYEPGAGDDKDDVDDDVSSGESEEEPESDASGLDDENVSPTSKKRKRSNVKSSIASKAKKTSYEPKTPLSEKLSNTETLTPKNETKLKSSLTSKLSNSVSKAQNSLSKFSLMNSPAQKDTEEDQIVYTHESLNWLKEGYLKDKHGRLHTDPDYDPRTLMVPSSYLNSKEVSPGMKQWWILKSSHFDTVIFFKVGKFYELYHMDAVTGVRELGLIYMKGKFAHCGFPEIGFSRYSDILVQKGYKVARVEQTETPEMMSQRKSGDKVVKREICAVISKGTRTFNFLEGQSAENEAAYLLAISERPCDQYAVGGSKFGVCFVDTSIGKFHIGQFQDDRQCSRLRTMLACYPPVQVLFERRGLSATVQHILNHELMATIKESLAPGTEFWDASKTLKILTEKSYFQDKHDKNSGQNAKGNWPETLQKMLSEGDSLGLTAADAFELAYSSLGACIWYLKKCCIEEELLSMNQFEEYIPIDATPTQRIVDFPQKHQHMILDGVTLTNLDITTNDEGTTEATLIELLDHCCTSFGKRLFKQWLCSPLCSVFAINARLDSVEDLMNHLDLTQKARSMLKTIPDVERLLRRIHSLGSLKRSHNHPDSRAIFYSETEFSKRKIGDLLSALEAFEKGSKIINLFTDEMPNMNSYVLRQILTMKSDDNEGKYPDVSEFIKFFKNAFDHSKAKNDGIIQPKEGVHKDYDQALADIKRINKKLDDYLEQQRKRLNCRGITYWSSGKVRYQLEIPISALARSTPDGYQLKSQKKTHKRFHTREIEKMLEEMIHAEDRRDAALKDTMRNIFARFDKHYESWEQATQCLATLDCLLSLAHYSSNIDGVSCRPQLVLPYTEDGSPLQPFMEILNSRHPCAGRSFSGEDFIPNDIVVGKTGKENDTPESSLCLIVTGPNMGGKSTLMRQAGALIIMAQLGCFVPAEVCRFTPVDRIFTRLGAQDRILHGESTFFVELSETATILHHANKHSLILLDELGRGTATYDGTAIASAVLRELAHNIKCRTLFSTHYHSLVDDFVSDPAIKLGHMSCMVEKDEGDDDPSNDTITFLYKLAEGDCPKSYGFNAAKLAGLPDHIIKKGHNKACHFEETTRRIRLFRRIFSNDILPSHVSNIRSLLSKSAIA